MSKRARRNHAPAFKAKVALAAIKGEKTLADLAQQFDIHSNQITQWKAQLLEGAAGVFGAEARPEPAAPAVDLKSLHAKIGELYAAIAVFPAERDVHKHVENEKGLAAFRWAPKERKGRRGGSSL